MADQRPATILVVDDTEANRYTIARLLQREGIGVLEAASGRRGLELARGAQPDLVLLDVRLPDLSGFEVCRLLREDVSTRAIPVIQISASFTDSASRVQGLEGGADAYITHPIDPPVLIATVRAMLRARRAEAALRRQEARHRALLEATTHIVWHTDADGRPLEENTDWSAFTGQRFAEYADAGWVAAIHPEDRERVAAVWRQVAAPGAVDRIDFRLRRYDGAWRWMTARWAPVRDEAGAIVEWVGATRDVTIERRTEEQLREAQRLHAVGTLAGGVAHEVNNALQGALGFGEFVLRALGPDHPESADMRLVLQAIERAARVSQQLLAYTRQQVSRPRAVDLAALVRALRPVLLQLLGADRLLELRLPEAPAAAVPPIHVDPGQVEQILINLAANARDATGTGGRVSVAVVALEGAAADTAAMGFTLPPGPYVRLAVEDSGAGMDDATRARIFDPFFTTKPVGEGTGLGLSMVYGIVKQHGGYIGVRSAPGRGTTMELYWPVAPEPARASGAHAPPRAGARTAGRGRTVLVAEDESLVRTLVLRTLEAAGYAVLAAEDGAAALALLETHGAPPDLLVTDVIMPRMNGRQLAEAVAARWPDVPVLFVSGHTDEDAALQRLVPAGAPFLQKPFSPDVLVAAVGAIADRL